MPDQLTEEQIAEFREAFQLFDHGAGTIAVQDIGKAMRCMGLSPTDAELRDMISAAGPGGTGDADFPSFLSPMAGALACPDGEQDVSEAFRIFDCDGSGFISFAEVRHVMQNLGDDSER
eukprot:gene10274-16726_t